MTIPVNVIFLGVIIILVLKFNNRKSKNMKNNNKVIKEVNIEIKKENKKKEIK